MAADIGVGDAAVHAYLNVPRREPFTYNRNFLRLVACELKFPTMMELEPGAIKRFQHAVRKMLPLYETPQALTLSLGSPMKSQGVIHQFTTKRKDMVFTFKPDSLTLQTNKYRSFEEFSELLKKIVEEALPIVDTDFFTRVGLRYINGVEYSRSDLRSLNGWINPQLVSTLTSGVYGSISQCIQVIQGFIPEGNYVFRHGISGEGEPTGNDYLLDFDFYAETIEANETFERLRIFRQRTYEFFMWALGERAIAHLVPEAGKNA